MIFLHSGGKQLATDFIIFPMRCSPIRVLEYQVAVIGRGIIVKYSGPKFFKASVRWLNYSSNSRTGSLSLSPPSVDHICCGEWRAGFRRPPCLVLVGFSLNSTFIFFSGPLRTSFLLDFYLFSLYFIADPSDAKTRAAFLKSQRGGLKY